MFVYKKRIHKKLNLGVALAAALIFSDALFAQSVGGVIKGTPTQQSQYQSGNSAINQNGRLLLELQSLRAELASLRNQVEQQGYQLRQLQNGQTPNQDSSSSGVGNSGSVNFGSTNNSTPTYGNSNIPAAGEIPTVASNNQQPRYQQGVPAAQSGSNNSASNNGGVNFPLLPQDQVSGQANTQKQALPQLVPQAQQQAIPQQQSSIPQQASGQGAQLTPQAKLLEGGDRGIKTNLNELELYNKGIDKLSAQDYKAAASIFSAQLQNFPKGEKAGDGYFWLAETFYILDDLDSSAKSYQSLVDLFPRHVRTPKALLKLISVHQDRSDTVSAKIAMNVLVKKYPGSEEAGSAKTQHAALL